MFLLKMVDYYMSLNMVDLDLGHLPDTQGSLGLLSEPCSPTHVSHKILVTAQVLGFGIWIGLWPRACQ